MQPSFGEKRREALRQVLDETVGQTSLGWTKDITNLVLEFFCDWPKESERYCPVGVFELDSDTDRYRIHDPTSQTIQLNGRPRFELSGTFIRKSRDVFRGRDILSINFRKEEIDFIRFLQRTCNLSFENVAFTSSGEGVEIYLYRRPTIELKSLDHLVFGCQAMIVRSQVFYLDQTLYLSVDYVKRLE